MSNIFAAGKVLPSIAQVMDQDSAGVNPAKTRELHMALLSKGYRDTTILTGRPPSATLNDHDLGEAYYRRQNNEDWKSISRKAEFAAKRAAGIELTAAEKIIEGFGDVRNPTSKY